MKCTSLLQMKRMYPLVFSHASENFSLARFTTKAISSSDDDFFSLPKRTRSKIKTKILYRRNKENIIFLCKPLSRVLEIQKLVAHSLFQVFMPWYYIQYITDLPFYYYYYYYVFWFLLINSPPFVSVLKLDNFLGPTHHKTRMKFWWSIPKDWWQQMDHEETVHVWIRLCYHPALPSPSSQIHRTKCTDNGGHYLRFKSLPHKGCDIQGASSFLRLKTDFQTVDDNQANKVVNRGFVTGKFIYSKTFL